MIDKETLEYITICEDAAYVNAYRSRIWRNHATRNTGVYDHKICELKFEYFQRQSAHYYAKCIEWRLKQ